MQTLLSVIILVCVANEIRLCTIKNVRQPSHQHKHRRCCACYLVHCPYALRVLLCALYVLFMCSSCVLRVFFVCSSCVLHVLFKCYSCVLHVLFVCTLLALELGTRSHDEMGQAQTPRARSPIWGCDKAECKLVVPLLPVCNFSSIRPFRHSNKCDERLEMQRPFRWHLVSTLSGKNFREIPEFRLRKKEILEF